jgi:hypothetical protein
MNRVFGNLSTSLEAACLSTSCQRLVRIILEAEASVYALAIANPIPADAPVMRIFLPDWFSSDRSGERVE